MKLILKFYDMSSLLSFAAMFACIGVEVISRNVIKMPTTWAEELSRFFCVWAVFMGSASAWQRKAHISIVGLLVRLKGRVKEGLLLFVNLSCEFFLAAVAIGAAMLMQSSYANKTTALEMSISYYYLALLLGLTGMIIFQTEILIRQITGWFKPAGREE